MSRLEEAREMIKNFYMEYESGHPMFADEDISLLNWLLNQAERVEKLEKEKRELNMEIGRYAGQVFDIKQTLGANIAELEILTVRMFGGEDNE